MNPRTRRREGEERALRRAALAARQLAAQKGTPLVVFKNGEVVRLQVTEEMLKAATTDEK